MSASTLFRLSGLALMLAVPLWVAGDVLHPRSEELADVVGSSHSLSHALLALAQGFMLIGLPGLYASHAARSGRLGLAGFVLMFVFGAYFVYALLFEAGPVAAMSADPAAERLFAPDGVRAQGMLLTWFAPVVILARIIYGIALLRSGAYSRSAAWLMIAFVPVFLALAVVISALPAAARQTLYDLRFTNIAVSGSFLLLLVGLAIPGYRLWTTRRHVPRSTYAVQLGVAQERSGPQRCRVRHGVHLITPRCRG